MISGYEDLFVGIVAISIGLFLICSAVVNWNWFYSLRTARWLQQLFGKNGARLVHVLLGLILIALGTAIALGYRWTLVGPAG